MKAYETPELEILTLDTADVICTSFDGDENEAGPGPI